MFGFTKRPLFLIAWKNLKTYPVRIFLTTSSIILGVAVIIASNIFSESNKSAFDNLFSGIYEGVDLVVQPIQEDFAEGFSGDGGQGPISFEVKKIPDERIEEISNLPSVKAAWGEVLGFAQFIKIVDGETVLISNGFAPTFGAAWDRNPYAPQWSLVEGEPPTNTKEVVMDVVTAENHGFTVGDRVTVLAGATPASFTIVGIAEFANVGAPGGATFALFEFRTAQKLLDSRGEVDLINVVIENNFDINDVKTEITNPRKLLSYVKLIKHFFIRTRFNRSDITSGTYPKYLYILYVLQHISFMVLRGSDFCICARMFISNR